MDQPEANGKTWKAYMQSYSLCTTPPLAHACGNQLYERKPDNPFISYQDVQNNPARVANIVDFSQFATDLASGNVADYTRSALTSAMTCMGGPPLPKTLVIFRYRP